MQVLRALQSPRRSANRGLGVPPSFHRDLCGIGRRIWGSRDSYRVTPDGAVDKYMRFGDAYVKHNDGRLDVIRGGAKPYSYASGDWTDVEGDEKSLKKGRFRG